MRSLYYIRIALLLINVIDSSLLRPRDLCKARLPLSQKDVSCERRFLL